MFYRSLLKIFVSSKYFQSLLDKLKNCFNFVSMKTTDLYRNVASTIFYQWRISSWLLKLFTGFRSQCFHGSGSRYHHSLSGLYFMLMFRSSLSLPVYDLSSL